MDSFQKPEFETVELADLTQRVADFKAQGYAFVQICASTLDDSCELLYAFVSPEREYVGMDGLIVNVPDGVSVPSITQWYPAAFVFENETHDLFGITIEGISIDYQGEFFTVAMDAPMNPRLAQAKAEEEKGE